MNKLGGFVTLMRPMNCVMMSFAVFVGALLASTKLQGNWLNIVFGFFTGLTLTAASMAITTITIEKLML